MNSTFLAIHFGRLSSASRVAVRACVRARVYDSMASNLHDENCTTFVSFPIVHRLMILLLLLLLLLLSSRCWCVVCGCSSCLYIWWWSKWENFFEINKINSIFGQMMQSQCANQVGHPLPPCPSCPPRLALVLFLSYFVLFNFIRA